MVIEGIPDIGPFRRRLRELDELMATPEFFRPAKRDRQAAEISREHRKLHHLLGLYDRLEALEHDIEEHESIMADPETEEEFRELVEEELPGLRSQSKELHQRVLMAMIPPDPSDSRNTVVEIRAGAGGDEASLFAADLHRMYLRYAEAKNWKVEPLGARLSEGGGLKQVACLISGEDVHRSLKYESGVHRVQRIPVTETNGRIHTSTATVAVLPEAEEVDIQIDPHDLEVNVSRASGPGGQGVNTTDSAVQIVHKPTGMTVHCADERSQLKNKNKALKVLRARLLRLKEEVEREKYAAKRRNQVGTGDRSERIRTYNFTQSRLTDHRIGLSAYNLPQVMEGALEELVDALRAADNENKVSELIEPGKPAPE